MKCRDAQHEIALLLGQDSLDGRQRNEVRGHLATCVDCRAHFRGLKRALEALETSEQPSTYEVQESIWPKLQSRLKSEQHAASASVPRRWVPAASVLAASLFAGLVWWSPGRDPSGTPHVPTVERQTVPTFSPWSTLSRLGEDRLRKEEEKPEDDRSAPEDDRSPSSPTSL